MSRNTPATRTQPSRKGKKAWRKNVDVSEVSEGLEQLREEIITGGVVKEKTNEQLFTIDIVGDKSIAKRHFKESKVLKVDEILRARSAVPAVSSKKRGPDSILTDGVLPEKKPRRKDWVSHREVALMKRIAYGATEAAVAKTSKGELADPWADPQPVEEEAKFSFIEKKQPVKAPATLKMAPVSLSATGAQIPALKIPEAGISYNPHFVDWSELLQKEGEKAVEEEKRRLKAEQEERERLERLAKSEAEELLREVQGHVSEEEESDDDEDEDQGNDTLVKKRAERKTRAQRNKEKRKREEERKRLAKLQEKKQKGQLAMLKHIKKAVEAKENARLEALAKKAEDDGDPEKAQKIRRKKLGKHHLPPKPLELQLKDELTDSLRRLKPEGNLLKDRYRSLMERGILETRVRPVIAKKRKTYEKEKWSYKDFK